MSDVMAIAPQAVSQSRTQLDVQVSLLKQQMDFQKETAQVLIEMIGLGGNVDVRA